MAMKKKLFEDNQLLESQNDEQINANEFQTQKMYSSGLESQRKLPSQYQGGLNLTDEETENDMQSFNLSHS
jgi:hypothetical protein